MTYTLLEEEIEPLEKPFTAETDQIGYGSVVAPNSLKAVTYIPREPKGWLEKLCLKDPGFDKIEEDQYHWVVSVTLASPYKRLARWTGYAPTHEEAWHACSEVTREWTKRWDHRPRTLADRATDGVS